ncbi:MAG TPA: VOC family protein [Xanthobacteraceae bacterium]|nr:VOC family protein [Xanthobacteraceae bacterium]
MARGLDHIVHVVRDLDAAAARYQRIGFTVGARNRHPWGTHNRLVQFPGFFIELLTIAEPDKLGADELSRLFGTPSRHFLERQEGFWALLLESRDAADDAAQFGEGGIAAAPAVRFEREGKRPDGTSVRVAFSLAFARDAKADAGFATCQQHFPESFWNPAFQSHPNGTSGVAGVVMVADNPSDHHVFLSAFTGEREMLATSNGISVKTPRGTIDVMTPAAYASHFGIAPPSIGEGARLAALVLAVRDSARLATMMDEAKVANVSRMGRTIVGPDTMMGAAIVFARS